MEALEYKGSVDVLGETIPNIEGGFGKYQKSMLAKDIAKFHYKKTKHVNETINNNQNRFRRLVDFIDIKKHENLAVDMVDRQIITQDAVNASNNIYLLSRRGYFKLVKIFDDDWSWEMFDQLLDDYFSKAKPTTEIVNHIQNTIEQWTEGIQQNHDAINDVAKQLSHITKQINAITNESNQTQKQSYHSVSEERQTLNSKVRRYAIDHHVDKEKAWDEFFKTYNYLHATNLRKRRTHYNRKHEGYTSMPALLEIDEEIDQAINVIDQMLDGTADKPDTTIPKLTEREVAQIYLDDEHSFKELAEKYNISPIHVCHIQGGTSRKNITKHLDKLITVDNM